MADPVKDKPLYDAMGYQSSARFWRGLLSNDIGASGGLDPEDVQIERRLCSIFLQVGDAHLL